MMANYIYIQIRLKLHMKRREGKREIIADLPMMSRKQVIDKLSNNWQNLKSSITMKFHV